MERNNSNQRPVELEATALPTEPQQKYDVLFGPPYLNNFHIQALIPFFQKKPVLFFLNGPTPASFSFIFWSFWNKQYNFYYK